MYSGRVNDTDTQSRGGHRWFAAVYDRLQSRAERGPMGRARRELLAGVRGDVLEIGAGTGANFEHYPAEARVVALEPDPHMLKRARARLEALQRTNIEIRLAPAETLPVEDASFDIVVSTLVLCTVSDPAQALAEIRRVLRPGGRLLFIEHVRGTGVLARFHDLIRPAWSWVSAGCQINRTTEQAMRDAGFDVTIEQRTKAMPILPVIIGTASPR
ncbi:MAG: class I SAM-dependent methyltransferase [Chloroflexi bacterium]|nr:class I SAM-dependent methyltransferase [Chloroflexota bacterium]